MEKYSAENLWIALIGDRAIDASAPFGQRVYDRIVRLVPYWRASTEAWLLSDDSYLVGIGVLRNYGGDLMVVDVDSLDNDSIRQLVGLARGDLSLQVGSLSNILLMLDDSALTVDDLPPLLGQFERLLWSSAESLAQYVISDEPTDLSYGEIHPKSAS